MNVRELKAALAKLGPSHEEKKVQTWLPRSYIRLQPTLIPHQGKILIEGNMEPGSALEDLSQ